MWTGSEWIPAPPVGGDVFSSKNESISVNKYPDKSSAKSNDSIVLGEFETLDRFMLISEQFFRWFPLHQHKWLKFLGINLYNNVRVVYFSMNGFFGVQIQHWSTYPAVSWLSVLAFFGFMRQ